MNLNNEIDRMKDIQHTTHDFKFNNKKRPCSFILKHPHSKGFIQTQHTSPWVRNEKAQIPKPRRVSLSRKNKASVKCFHDRDRRPILMVIGDTRIDQEIYLQVGKHCTTQAIHLENIFKRLSPSPWFYSFFFNSISTLFSLCRLSVTTVISWNNCWIGLHSPWYSDQGLKREESNPSPSLQAQVL